MNIGILALQGAVEPHKQKLRELGVGVTEVRTPSDLQSLSGIILPGGESTTFLHLMKLNELIKPLTDLALRRPIWGVCAGAIVLAKEVSRPTQSSLQIIDISIERNAYGRQIDSFIDQITPVSHPGIPDWKPQEGVFIRAPRIKSTGPRVSVLFMHHDEPVMVEEGTCLVTTFHPELSNSLQIHRYFVEKCHG